MLHLRRRLVSPVQGAEGRVLLGSAAGYKAVLAAGPAQGGAMQQLAHRHGICLSNRYDAGAQQLSSASYASCAGSRPDRAIGEVRSGQRASAGDLRCRRSLLAGRRSVLEA